MPRPEAHAALDKKARFILLAAFAHCYNSAALGNATEQQLNRASRPVSARALALPLCQLAVGVVAAALAALAVGAEAAMALLAGVVVIAAAQLVFSWRTDLRSHSATASRMFGRLLLGTLLKWLVIGAGLAIAMTQGLIPAYVLGGALLAFLAYLICLPWLLR
jgi:apolipoprotein N-acyltransferase